MRVQFDAASIRLRLDRAEFQRLLAQDAIAVVLQLPAAPAWSVSVRSGSAFAVDESGGEVSLTVPAAELDAFAETLPSRHGLAFDWPRPGAEALRITLDVDVRDGRRAPR